MGISDWVLHQWEIMGLIHSVQLPDGHIINYLSQETVDAYIKYRNARQVK